jgi:hypothetical protein
MPISQETIDKVKAEHPGLELELLIHPTLPDQALARVPEVGVYETYLQMLGDPAQRPNAARALCYGSILSPDKKGIDEMFKGHPALPGVWAGEIAEMAGATLKASRKKV